MLKSLVRALAALFALLGASASIAAPDRGLLAAARREGKVVVYSVLSTKAARPLIEEFRALYPGIEVEYDGDKGSSEMDARYRSETASGQQTADVVWSSASDTQMKLVADGFAAHYRSPEARYLPAWARYRDQAWGTTLEPVVIVYNSALLRGRDVPRDHAALAQLLESEPERFRGKVTGFDIAKSAVGFMFAAQDRNVNRSLDRLLAALGSADFRASGGTGEMLTAISKGERLLGYNMMGAYALSRGKRDLPNLGVVFPSDYTLILPRAAIISKRAAHPAAARLWLDYLLSERGQRTLGNKIELYAARGGVQADYTADKLRQQLGRSFRPIPLDKSLVRDLAPQRHEQIRREWEAAIATGRGNNNGKER